MLENGPAPPPLDALARNATFPLNLRYAGAGPHRHLTTDAWIDGSALAACVSDFRGGVRRAARPQGTPRPVPVAEPDPYEELFRDLARLVGPIDVVERMPEWEVGPRIRGRRVAVRVSPERAGLRLHRLLAKRSELGHLASDPRARALADLALRLNVEARFARLALDKTGICVEARLPARLADIGRVAETARAIAIVSAAVKLRLELLMRYEDVARRYVQTFHLSNGDAAR